MADLTRTVEVIFGATLDASFAQTASTIQDSLGIFNTSIQGAAEPLGNLADSLLKVDAVVAGLAATYGTYAVNQAIKFQNAQIDLNKVLSDGDAPIESFTGAVTELSEKYGISSDVILQGIANFKQAGFTAEESAQLQKNALDLVIAGDIDASRASEVLVTSLKGMGAEASSASRFIEAMNNVSNDYATDVDQLAEGMSRISPILKTMGFSFEEGTGLITPIIEVFGQGSIAADALKTGLLKLVDDAKPVQQALEALGVSQTDLNGNMRSGKDIFYDVATAFQHVEQNQKLVFASQLFGLEQAPKLVTVFDNLAKVNEITASALAHTGSVTKEVELRLESADKQIDRFKVGFENLSRVLGGEIISEFAGIIGGATDIENAFRKVVEGGGLEPLFNALRPQMDEFEELLKTIARNLPEAFDNIDFSGLLEAFEDLQSAFKEEFDLMFKDVDLTTAEGLHTAIQKIINIVKGLLNVTTGIVQEFKPIFAFIGELADQTSNAADESSKAAGKLLGVMKLLSDFGTGMGLFIVVLNESQANITNVFNTIVGGSRIFTNALQVAFDILALTIAGALEDITFSIAKFLDSVGADETAQKFYDAGAELKLSADGIKANLQSNAKDMADAWDQMTDGLTGSSNKSAEAIKQIGAQSADTKEIVGHAKDSMIELGTAAFDIFEANSKWSESIDKVAVSIIGIANTQDRYNYLINQANDTTLTAEQRSRALAIAMQLQDEILDQTIDTQESYNNLIADAEAKGLAYTTYWDGSKQAIKVWDSSLEDATQTVEKNLNAQGKLTEAQKLAIENAQELSIELEKLASNERIRAMEFTVELNIEQVKAAAQVMTGILDSTNSFFESSGDVINSLVQGLTDAFGPRDKEFFREIIEMEMDLRQQEIDLQYEVLATQERMFQNQLDMNREGLSVKIEAEGLDADLEKIMITILNRIRTSITGDYTQFLLASTA